MSEAPKKTENPGDFKKAVAKQRHLKRLRKMKIKDRSGDVDVSDISDVDVQGDGEEESQEGWLNDLLKGDGDGSGKDPSPQDAMKSMETTEQEPETFASKFCAFTSENSVNLQNQNPLVNF
uniref:RRP15-like protein n=1 Tax=Caenorhabditis tropicalis TaxID=1561998 RepID=A0A1I7URC4_9PELO